MPTISSSSTLLTPMISSSSSTRRNSSPPIFPPSDLFSTLPPIELAPVADHQVLPSHLFALLLDLIRLQVVVSFGSDHPITDRICCHHRWLKKKKR
ncbi:hypothetical protein ZIOFF_001176 [Zingiber officinale]|uniref:Uncharacterized protein n=1 Tax=Zingiber officinale TaxID=94328 RepID=A0A8J5M8D1_ZINOF|nr:hypothetical protein ZIOFF_001176 [Zingiber officinale]